MNYFEIVYWEPGKNYPTKQAFNTLQDAINNAELLGTMDVYEIGGNWGEYTQCPDCRTWYDVSDGECARCNYAYKHH